MGENVKLREGNNWVCCIHLRVFFVLLLTCVPSDKGECFCKEALLKHRATTSSIQSSANRLENENEETSEEDYDCGVDDGDSDDDDDGGSRNRKVHLYRPTSINMRATLFHHLFVNTRKVFFSSPPLDKLYSTTTTTTTTTTNNNNNNNPPSHHQFFQKKHQIPGAGMMGRSLFGFIFSERCWQMCSMEAAKVRRGSEIFFLSQRSAAKNVTLVGWIWLDCFEMDVPK